MLRLSLEEIAKITDGQLVNHHADVQCAGISIDSRTLQPGNLFFAIHGEALDGHEFVAQAKAQGAIAAIVDHKLNQDLPQIIVKDTTKALGKLTQHWRNQFALPIIAVTGSNGKTTTKNMLQAIFAQALGEKHVLATQGNFNNYWGLPLMLAKLTKEHRVAILEMGMNHFGEIEYLTHLATPSTAIITNAAPAHLAGVGGTIQGVAKAKGEIYAGLTQDGVAVINADDEFANYWRQLNSARRCVTFGIDQLADVQGKLINNGFALQYKNQTIDIHLPLLGKHNVLNALAACAAALVNHVDLTTIKVALENIQPTARRLQPKKGRNEINVIDDSYNANPSSLRAAMEVLATYPGKKILVLGDMRELGEQGPALHYVCGKKARELAIDHVFAVGDLMREFVAAFGDGAFHFESHAELIRALENYLAPGVTLLIKGSNSMQMDSVVKALML